MEPALPDSSLVTRAVGLVRAVMPESMFRHSVRTFLLARAYARRRGIEHDEEGLALAAIFHDLGLCPPYRDRARPFPEAGSRALRGFLAEAGGAPERASPLADAIDFHFQLRPPWSQGAVAGLLQVGAWMDCTGLRRWAVWRESRAIARAWPRGGWDLLLPVRLLGSCGSWASCAGLFFPARFRPPPDARPPAAGPPADHSTAG